MTGEEPNARQVVTLFGLDLPLIAFLFIVAAFVLTGIFILFFTQAPLVSCGRGGGCHWLLRNPPANG